MNLSQPVVKDFVRNAHPSIATVMDWAIGVIENRDHGRFWKTIKSFGGTYLFCVFLLLRILDYRSSRHISKVQSLCFEGECPRRWSHPGEVPPLSVNLTAPSVLKWINWLRYEMSSIVGMDENGRSNPELYDLTGTSKTRPLCLFLWSLFTDYLLFCPLLNCWNTIALVLAKAVLGSDRGDWPAPVFQ